MFGLKEKTISDLNSIFSKYEEVEKVVIYGSRAMGNYRNGSDIDIVFFGDSMTLSLLFKIQDEIEELLLPYMFDMALFSHIDIPGLKDHIQRVGKIFYQKQI